MQRKRMRKRKKVEGEGGEEILRGRGFLQEGRRAGGGQVC